MSLPGTALLLLLVGCADPIHTVEYQCHSVYACADGGSQDSWQEIVPVCDDGTGEVVLSVVHDWTEACRVLTTGACPTRCRGGLHTTMTTTPATR